MDMSESPRRLALGLLLIAGLAACGSPDPVVEPPLTAPSASVVSPSQAPPPSSAAPASTPPSTTTTTTTTTTPAAPVTSPPDAQDRALPLTLSRTGGIAGVQDQVKVTSDGTATVTRRGGGPTKATLSGADLTTLRNLLTSPALAREAKLGRGEGVCADGFKYELRTPTLALTMDDCGRSNHPTLAKVISLVLPPGGK